MTNPLLSYVVLSYNYERYIRRTLESIFAQSVQDFEIVVVDDASSDRSVEVVESFNDPRIRLLRNDTNRGGAASYNRAVEAARGEWLVNLDADDWVAPRKAELQLAAVRADPRPDVVGTYVSVRDETGGPHRSDSVRSSVQSLINTKRDFNLTDTWIGANYLCRSSTMVRASAHRRIGLDDPDMVRAPDYELWTRFLRAGCRIEVVPRELTFMRVHSRQVTHADPLVTFLEMSYAALRNLVPRCESHALYPTYAAVVGWVARNPALSGLLPVQSFRLIGMFVERTPVSSFREFISVLESEDERLYLSDLGRRGLALMNQSTTEHTLMERLYFEVALRSPSTAVRLSATKRFVLNSLPVRAWRNRR
jgi:glycosyltransferase involved in cell wall biosynthesis